MIAIQYVLLGLDAVLNSVVEHKDSLLMFVILLLHILFVCVQVVGHQVILDVFIKQVAVIAVQLMFADVLAAPLFLFADYKEPITTAYIADLIASTMLHKDQYLVVVQE